MGVPPNKSLRQRILAAFDNLRPGDTLTRDDLARLLHRAHAYIGNATDHMQRDGELVNTSPPGRTARYRPASVPPSKNTRSAIEHMLLALTGDAYITTEMIVARTSVVRSTANNHMAALLRAGHCYNSSPANMPGRYRLTDAGRAAIEDRIAAEAAEAAEAAPPPNITPPRVWHHASTGRATGDDLNPWRGAPMRDGALDASLLPSRGIRA